MTTERSKIPFDQLVVCLILALCDKQKSSIRSGSASTISEDISSEFDLTVDLHLIVKAAKILESIDVAVVSSDIEDDPWISVDINHFDWIFQSRRNATVKRHISQFFVMHPAVKSYGEFRLDWFEYLIGSYKLLEGESPEIDPEQRYEIDVPAADRVVTLAHNKAAELDAATTELSDLVEKENGIDGDPIKRDLIIGQLKAGRELIRAHTFRAYLLYKMLISTLGQLIEKYGTAAIGTAAKRLLELLVEHVFGK